MSRKSAREIVMKYVYQMQITNDFALDKLSFLLESEELSKPDSSFIEVSLESIITNLDQIDQNISKNLDGWKVERIPKVDLAILRVAVNEIDYMEDVPDSVAINEAVDMAKAYSTDDSYKFINGVLGTYFRSKEV